MHRPSATTSGIQSSPLTATSEKVTITPFPYISLLVEAQQTPSILIFQGMQDVVMPEIQISFFFPSKQQANLSS